LLINWSWLSAQSLKLNKVIVEGAVTISADEMVKALNLTQDQVYEPELGKDIIIQLQDFLIKKGYYFATVKQKDIIPIDNTKVNLVYSLDEGFSGILSEVRFNGNRYYSTHKLMLLLDISGNGNTNLTALPGLMERTLDLYTSRGYLFAQVQLDSLQLGKDSLTAVIRIDEGPLFKTKNYYFTGNKITRSNTLIRISGLSQAEVITPDVIAMAEDNLRRKEYISDCRIAPIDAGTLGIEITEGRMTKAEGVFGLTTDPVSAKKNLNGFIDLQFLNLWGTDRAISLYWKSLKTDYRLLELSYHESGFSAYPIAGDLMFQRAQQDSAWIRIKAQVSLYYQYFSHKFGTELYSENLYPDSPDSTVYEKTRYYNTSLFWEYYRTDYAPNPSSGSQFRIKSGWLFRNSESRTGSIPVNEVDATGYYPLKGRLVLAAGLHYREISDRNASLYEQYKMGGFKSLRGYNEDSFNGWRLGWVNLELRYLMTRNSRIYLLIDNGFLQAGKQNLKSDLSGIGAGISNKTKLGTISISYALSIMDKRLADWDSGMLHMGLASSF
jgi:outer membrane protein assembly factor BamA